MEKARNPGRSRSPAEPEPIRVARYTPDALGVELLTFAHLRQLRAGQRPWELVRTDFHVVARCESGAGDVTVDFVRHRFGGGDVVWIRPGWTHRWDDVADVEGAIILFRPELLRTASAGTLPPGLAGGPIAPTTELAAAAFQHLRQELAAEDDSPTAASVLRNLLEVLLLRLAPHPRDDVSADSLFATFAATVETNFPRHRNLAWYAARLGYAPRTLSRASQAAAGIGAKRFIDDRVALEAQRLLAHTDDPVGRIAQHVGFDDAANFAKFFRTRSGGMTPGRFRESVRARE